MGASASSNPPLVVVGLRLQVLPPSLPSYAATADRGGEEEEASFLLLPHFFPQKICLPSLLFEVALGEEKSSKPPTREQASYMPLNTLGKIFELDWRLFGMLNDEKKNLRQASCFR